MDDGGDTLPPEGPRRPADVEVTVAYEAPGVRVVEARGEFDLTTIAPLSDALAEAVRSHGRVVLDASGIEFGDSSLLNLLLHVHRDGDLRIAAPGHQLRSLFTITGADTVLDIRDSVQAAVQD